MTGPRIIVEGQREHVRQLANKLIRPADGLRPWRQIVTSLYPWGMRMEFAPLAEVNGRPARHLLSLTDYCKECKYARRCAGRGTAHARACADIEVSTLRRVIERDAGPLHFTYQPPVYGEEDVNYRLTGV